MQQLSRLSIRFAKNNVTPIQFNAKTLTLISHFFQKRILMTFDHVPIGFGRLGAEGREQNNCTACPVSLPFYSGITFYDIYILRHH